MQSVVKPLVQARMRARFLFWPTSSFQATGSRHPSCKLVFASFWLSQVCIGRREVLLCMLCRGKAPATSRAEWYEDRAEMCGIGDEWI